MDMDSKAGDLFIADEGHPTGTGGAGIMAKYELIHFYLKYIYIYISILGDDNM